MDDAAAQLTPYLLPDETLLWTGRPDPAKHLARGDLFLVPFGLVWGGFAISWLVVAIAQGAPAGFALFGVPLVALGVQFIAGRFVVKARRKRRTAYGLTHCRALVAVGPGSFSEAPLATSPIAAQRSRDGRHLSVTVGAGHGWPYGAGWANSGMEFLDRGSGPLGFYDVADVAGLEDALREARR